MKNILLCILCFTCVTSIAQVTQTQIDKTIQGNTWHTYVAKATNYNSTTTKYPLILQFPGLGETGGAASLLLSYGPSRFINLGTWNGTATVAGRVDTFLVISMECPFTNCYVQQGTMNAILDTVINDYRVDTNRIYVMGYSAGGFVPDNYVTANGNATELGYANRIAAIVALSAVVPNFPISEFSRYVLHGGRWWGITGTNDQRSYPSIVNVMEAAKVGSSRVTYFTTGGGGHCCWNTFYDPAYTEIINEPPFNGTAGNIYQWVAAQTLQHRIPTVSAGSDATITLPTNSIRLQGSATPAAGTIIIKSVWRQISGPNNATIAQ